MCDRIVIFVRGKIVKLGTPTELKRLTEERSVIEITFAEDIRARIEELSGEIPETEVFTLGTDKVRIK